MQERSWTSIVSTLAWLILVLVAIRYCVRAYPDWREWIYAAGTFSIFAFWALDIGEQACAMFRKQAQDEEGE